LASELVTNAVWWSVLMRGWFEICVCEIDVAILFLMLASVATIAMDCNEDDSITTELSCWRQNLSFFPLLHKLKENLSEKMSITQKPRESSGWVGEKEENVPWDLLLELTRWPLMFAFYRSWKSSGKKDVDYEESWMRNPWEIGWYDLWGETLLGAVICPRVFEGVVW